LQLEHRKWNLLTTIRSDRVPTGEIFAVRLNESQSTIEALSRHLSSAEAERARRFYFDRDRRRFTVARGTLRLLLGERLGVAAAAVEFSYGSYGKPALAPAFEDSGWCFNLTHSEDLALIALCRNRQVGIDVEWIRSLNDERELVRSSFSTREQQEYEGLDPTVRTAAFFHGWTRKEALIKLLGKGLSQSLTSFDVTLAPDAPAQLLRFEDRTGASTGFALASFAPAPGFIAAIALNAYEVSVI
jgi:4'-phosphopantetheinyl transferase